MNNMDEVLSHIGLGWFQVFPMLTSLLIQGSYATQHMATIFTDMPRNFRCYTDVSDTENSTSFNNLCWIRNQSDTSLPDNKEYMCTEFVYDTTVFETTFSAEFNLVCEKTWISGIFKTAGFAGLIFGCIFTGMGDKWGRVLVIQAGSFLYLISVLVVGLSQNIHSVIIARFLIGCCYEILNASSYTLMMEVLPLSYRSIIGIILPNIANISFIIITGTTSYFIRNWRILHLTLSIPVYLLFVCIFLLHKSPRWLVNVGNIDAGINVLNKAAKLNRVILSSRELDSIREHARSSAIEVDEEVQSNNCQVFYTFISLLKKLFNTSAMCKISLTFPFLWFLTGSIYYSIPLNANNFSSTNPFLYIIVLAIADIPPNIFVPKMIKHLGNVKTMSIMFILTMPCLVSVIFVPEHLTWVKWSITFIAMMTISSTYMIAYILGSELFPTSVRAVGFGMGSIAKHAGVLAVQYVIDAATVVRMWWLPNAVAAGCCLIAGLVSALFFPETHGLPLCETIEDCESRNRSEK